MQNSSSSCQVHLPMLMMKNRQIPHMNTSRNRLIGFAREINGFAFIVWYFQFIHYPSFLSLNQLANHSRCGMRNNNPIINTGETSSPNYTDKSSICGRHELVAFYRPPRSVRNRKRKITSICVFLFTSSLFSPALL